MAQLPADYHWQAEDDGPGMGLSAAPPLRPVVVLGDANVDLMVQLPDYAAGSRDLSRSAPQLYGGGTCGNVAVALARLGVPVLFAGALGDDGYGRWIRDDFAREGVDTSGIVWLPDAFTPTVIAMVQVSGERDLVVFPTDGGAPNLLEPPHLNAAAIERAAWLHTTGICLRGAHSRDAILHGMRLARAAGVPISLDLNLRIELWGYDDSIRQTIEEAISLADVVLGNGAEEIIPVASAFTLDAPALTGTGAAKAGLKMTEAARRLSGAGRVIIARNGADGVLAVSAEGVHHSPAFPVEVVNAIGAGDAFNGGFIAAQVAGLDLPEALHWGNAVAALKLGQPGGARGGLPGRAAVLKLLGTAT
jgi:sugar/nucleoside kinase (ribokinase family)